jgi:hypothetical protein
MTETNGLLQADRVHGQATKGKQWAPQGTYVKELMEVAGVNKGTANIRIEQRWIEGLRMVEENDKSYLSITNMQLIKLKRTHKLAMCNVWVTVFLTDRPPFRLAVSSVCSPSVPVTVKVILVEYTLHYMHRAGWPNGNTTNSVREERGCAEVFVVSLITLCARLPGKYFKEAMGSSPFKTLSNPQFMPTCRPLYVSCTWSFIIRQ